MLTPNTPLKTELPRHTSHSWFPTPTLVLPPCPARSHWQNYTPFHKLIVSAEWLRQIRPKYPHAPQPPSGNVSSRLHAQFLLHHLSLCNNLYKLLPYLTMCGHRNPMSLLRLRSQSHQSNSPHMLTIDDNQRDVSSRWLSSMLLLPVVSVWLGNPPHSGMPCNLPCRTRPDPIPHNSSLWHLPTRLDCPDHPPTNLPYPRWPPIYPPQKNYHVWFKSTLPAILDFVFHLETFLYKIT